MMRYAFITMKRTMIVVPDELDRQLRFEAGRRGVPIAEVTREALTEYFESRSDTEHLSFIGIVDGQPDDSERVAEHVTTAIRKRARQRL